MFGKFCLPNFQELPDEINNNTFIQLLNTTITDISELQSYFNEIIDLKKPLLYCLLTCVIVSIFYNLLIRFFAKTMIWVSVIGVGVGMLLLAIFCKKYYDDNYSQDSQNNNQTFGKTLNISVYVLYGLTGIYFLTILCLFNNIRISIQVFQTSAVIITNNLQILLMPFITSIFVIAYISLWIVGFGYLISCANIEQPTGNQQLKSINLNDKDNLKWQIAVFVFGLFWISELIYAIFQYILIVGVC